MHMHANTFDYLRPTEAQMAAMTDMRQRAAVFAQALNAAVPDGPDKTFILRRFREVAMWVNVAITRHADGSPRGGAEAPDRLGTSEVIFDPTQRADTGPTDMIVETAHETGPAATEAMKEGQAPEARPSPARA